MFARTGFRYASRLVPLLVAVASTTAAASPAQVRDRTCDPRWTVAHEVPGAAFKAVAAAPSDVWVVGMKGKRPVVVRWNGRSWRNAPTPNGPLASISASAGDVWAVAGDAVWKWHGAKWRRLPALRLPTVRGGFRPESLSLRDVVALSPTNVWVVGSLYWTSGTPESGGENTTLVERWDGRAWRVVDADSSAETIAFDAVAAAGADHIWAVGAWSKGAYVARIVGTWNGTRWNTRSDDLPDVGTNEDDYAYNWLADVDARGPDDVWAVGSNLERPFVEHWNGRRWSHAQPGSSGVLYGVAAVAKSEVWAVGGVSDGDVHLERPLIAHRTMSGWRLVRPPRLRGALVAVDAVSPSQLWAVGGDSILRYGC